MNNRLLNVHDGEPVITVTSVSKTFGSRPVLRNIDIHVQRAQGLCICGVNGAGKSTLLRIIAGLLKPAQGEVTVCGFNVDSEPQKTKSQLGVILHQSMLYPHLTIFENLLFFAKLYGLKDSHDRVEEVLEDLGLSPYRYDKASVLSRGMLQRLAIARAMVHRPAVLLADEPFTGLDGQASRHLISVLSKFRAGGGTFVMTTHNANLALQCCDRVMVLDKNHFIFDAETGQIDTDRFTEDYLLYARS
ncbi:MAG: ABC transporter ATP-binding protein [Sedimentisphaerales bacterium]